MGVRVLLCGLWFSYFQTLFNGSIEGTANHYGLNMINQKITFPRDDNFSDDELAFLPYFTYFYNLKVRLHKSVRLGSIFSMRIMLMYADNHTHTYA